MPTPSPAMTTIVFDLGGVLYDFQSQRLFSVSTGQGRPWPEITRDWVPLIRRFETGALSAEEFATTVITTYGLGLGTAEFLYWFAEVAQGFYPNALDLVRAVSIQHRVVSLSNTNSVHWPIMVAGMLPDDPFHHHFPSQVIGHHKPDAASYRTITDSFGPGRYVFLDDRIENVKAAQAAGWEAHCVRGVVEASAALVQVGLLSPTFPSRSVPR